VEGRASGHPAVSVDEPVPSGVDGPVPSGVDGPVPSGVEGLALQLSFEVMNLDSQPFQPELWATALFSKLLPEVLITLALLFIILAGIFVGRNNVGNQKRAADALSEKLLEEKQAKIPKAYDI
jgi:hypothetical protein